MNLDIIGLAETHLRDDGNKLEFPGYKWYGHNRSEIHIRARNGFGGVGFLLKQKLLDYCFVQHDQIEHFSNERHGNV